MKRVVVAEVDNTAKTRRAASAYLDVAYAVSFQTCPPETPETNRQGSAGSAAFSTLIEATAIRFGPEGAAACVGQGIGVALAQLPGAWRERFLDLIASGIEAGESATRAVLPAADATRQ